VHLLAWAGLSSVPKSRPSVPVGSELIASQQKSALTWNQSVWNKIKLQMTLKRNLKESIYIKVRFCMCACANLVWRKMTIYGRANLKPKPINRALLQVFTSVSDRPVGMSAYGWPKATLTIVQMACRSPALIPLNPSGWVRMAGQRPAQQQKMSITLTHPEGVSTYGLPKASSPRKGEWHSGRSGRSGRRPASYV